MTSDAVLRDHSVVVAGDQILAIEANTPRMLPAGVARIDCAGRYLLPGLTDAHIHLGHPSELLLYLRYGVTTVFNLGGDYLDLFSGDRMDILALRDSVQAGAVPGPTLFTAGQSLDGDPPTGPFQQPLASAADAEAAVAEQHAAGYDFVKVYDSLPPDVHAAIIEAARQQGMAVLGHIPEAVGVDGTLASGQQVIAHAEEFYPAFEAADDVAATIDSLAKAVRAAGVTVMPNTAFIRSLMAQLEDLDAELAHPDVRYLSPRVRVWWEPRYNYYTNRDNAAVFLEQTRAKYRWLLPLVAAMHREGVPLLLGSDAAVPVALPGRAVHDELDDLVAAGLTPFEALQTATSNVSSFAATHLPQHPGFGTLRVGHRADLLLVQANPLDSISNLRMIDGVMARGRWFTPTELTTLLDEAAARFDE